MKTVIINNARRESASGEGLVLQHNEVDNIKL